MSDESYVEIRMGSDVVHLTFAGDDARFEHGDIAHAILKCLHALGVPRPALVLATAIEIDDEYGGSRGHQGLGNVYAELVKAAEEYDNAWSKHDEDLQRRVEKLNPEAR